MGIANRRIPGVWVPAFVAALVALASVPMAQVTSAEDVAARDAEREQIAALNAAQTEAKVLQRQRKYSDAVEAYNRVLRMDSSLVAVYLNLGLCHKRLKNDDEALGAFRNAAALDSMSIPPRLEIANLLLRQGRLTDARGAFTDIKADFADSVGYSAAADNGLARVGAAYANEAVRAHRQRQYDESAAAARLAVELSPDTFRPWFALGRAEEGRKNLDGGQTAYDEALRRAIRNKERAGALRGLGSIGILRARAQRGNEPVARRHRQAAVDFLQQSVAADSTSHTSYIKLGSTLFELGRLARARAALLRAEEIRPRNHGAPLKLAEIYIVQERWSDAEAAAGRAIRARRRNAAAHAFRAEALENLGRLREALEEYDKAKRDPRWRQRAEFKIKKIRERMQ